MAAGGARVDRGEECDKDGAVGVRGYVGDVGCGASEARYVYLTRGEGMGGRLINGTELLIVGTGRRNLLLSKEDRSRITELGIRMDVMSTRNAAAQYNLLAVERLPGQVACAMLIEEFGKKT